MWKPGQIISFKSTKDGKRIRYRVKSLEHPLPGSTSMALSALMDIYRRLIPMVKENLSPGDYLCPIIDDFPLIKRMQLCGNM